MAKRRKGKGKHYKKNVEDIDSDTKQDRKQSRSSRKHEKKSRKDSKRSKAERQARKRREDLIFFTVLIIIVAGIFGAYFVYDIYLKDLDDTSENGNPPPVELSIGDPAPYFELTDTDDVEFSLTDYLGNITIITFIKDFDPQCHEEMIHLNEVYEQYHDKGVEILSIGILDTESHRQMKDSFKMAYLCPWRFSALGGEVAKDYGVGNILPGIYIMDTQGKIMYINSGLTDAIALSGELDKLLG